MTKPDRFRARRSMAGGRPCLLALALSTACGVSGGSEGTTYVTQSDTGTDDGAWQDGVPCTFACQTAADCCIGNAYPASGDFPGLECPSNRFPNDWSCVSNECVNAGCSSDADCALDLFECHDIDGVGFCILPCSSNLECSLTNGQLYMECTGVADDDEKYCLEPPP